MQFDQQVRQDLPRFRVDVLKLDLMAGNWGAFAIKDEKSGRGCSTIYTANKPAGLLLLVCLGDAFRQVLMVLHVRRRIDMLNMLYFGIWLGSLQGVRARDRNRSNWHKIHSVPL
jgi:hypothetical protein